MKYYLLLTIFSLALRRGTGCEPMQTDCETKERPLLLTPLINANQSKLAKQKSLVTNLPGSKLESYSGYITVGDPECDSNLFFWFFPAQDDPEEAPLMLWLNGGPGRTSLYGAMLENGPLQLTDPKDDIVKPREVTWAKYFSMLYVDNPVGVGFSYSRGQCYPTNVTESTISLYSFLEQFFVLFLEYRNVDFYVGGQSYAGKYIPVLAHYIHHRNLDNPKVHMSLTGIYLGGAFTDPETMFPEFPDYLYNFGVYTDHTRRMHLKDITEALAKPDHNPFHTEDKREIPDHSPFHTEDKREIPDHSPFHTEDNSQIQELFSYYFGKKYQPQDGPLQDDIRLITPNLLQLSNEQVMEQFMSRPRIQAALHAIKEKNGVINFGLDVMRSTKREMAFLMDHYKVLYYTGNMDPKVNVRMGEAFLLSTNWTGQDAYSTSVRLPWMEKGELAGFVTQVQNFTRVIIRNCGHDAPSDQPEWTLAMMKRFVDNIPFSFPKDNNQSMKNKK